MGLFTKIFDDILGIWEPPKAPPPPPLPEPAPENIKATGASDEIRRRQRARMQGRRETIVTGDLTPDKPGKVNLLGRTT